MLRPPGAPARSWAHVSLPGLFFAGVLFAGSLTPSLMPREYLVQGLLSGITIALGYGLGVFLNWLWEYLQVPKPRARFRKVLIILSVCCVAALVGIALWRLPTWQDSVRKLMGMPRVDAYRIRVVLIAVITAFLLLVTGKVLRICLNAVARFATRVAPVRVSYVLSVLFVGSLLILLARGVLARSALRAADAAFLRVDQYVNESDIPRPSDALSSGGPGSLVPWDTIGRMGKDFIVSGPDQQQIGRFWNAPALQPLRVYVGLRSADTDEDRATLALEELKRVGAFNRAVLIVATPTGTGWLEAGAVDTVEYLHAGNTAIVSMQYSYLPSWLTILVDPDRSIASSRALFDKVYAYWRQLPADTRPRFYLQGLSLGSLGSESCADLFTLFEAPIHGGVWSGPPFPSQKWASIVRDRNPGSPVWLPEFRDGTMVRFSGRTSTLADPAARWGPMRFVYIQYPSDPMTFFSTSLLYEKPEWLSDPRGDDVSPYLSWYPLVTFLQVVCDLPTSSNVPAGFGHNISPDSYIDAWTAVTHPQVSPQDVERLRGIFTTPAYRDADHQ